MYNNSGHFGQFTASIPHMVTTSTSTNLMGSSQSHADDSVCVGAQISRFTFTMVKPISQGDVTTAPGANPPKNDSQVTSQNAPAATEPMAVDSEEPASAPEAAPTEAAADTAPADAGEEAISMVD